jgi:hypothetical protein
LETNGENKDTVQDFDQEQAMDDDTGLKLNSDLHVYENLTA